jgi:hypothetical protein
MLSRITIGSLQDLGYKVNYNKADKYTKANLGPGCTCPSTRRTRRRFLAHGDTMHLGQLRPSSDNQTTRGGAARRKISESAHQMAVEYGQSLLAKRAASYEANRNAQEGTSSEAVYVGHKVVSVLVYDQDEVYGVVVHR